MFKLKLIARDAIPAAQERAERYRLLNEPVQAESICRDILSVDPKNERALVTLLLSLTDQFESRYESAGKQGAEVLARIENPYMRLYYEGIIYERQADAQIRRDSPSAPYLAHELLHHAMACYEKAEAQHPAGNDEAILRWNTCVRTLLSHPELKARPQEPAEAMLE